MLDDIVPPAVEALASGKCDTMALVYAAASRAIGRVYGGSTYRQEGATPMSYYYFSPWGWELSGRPLGVHVSVLPEHLWRN